MKKDKKECSFCKHAKKVRESYERQGSVDDYIKEMMFAKTKPFKVSFNENLQVSFSNKELNEQKSKKLTPKDKKQKEEAVKSLKKKMPYLKKKYAKGKTGEAAENRAKSALYGIATKMAKKKP
jgi:hypothetical protein